MFLFVCSLQGLTCKDVDCLPFGVAMPIREALHQSAADPPLTLPTGAYQLIGECNRTYQGLSTSYPQSVGNWEQN